MTRLITAALSAALTAPVDRLYRMLDERIDDGLVLQTAHGAEGERHVSTAPTLGLAAA